MEKPNILYIMTDQQRFDTIAALGNSDIYTPNIDRLVRRGVAMTNAYSPTPVCVPARYIIRTGCHPTKTGSWANGIPQGAPHQAESVTDRCGPYLAQTLKARGYRTFGIGKFHSVPHREDLGYDDHIHAEELADHQGDEADPYFKDIYDNHPEYRHIEQPHGERTEMYYMPQTNALPAELNQEGWVTDRALKLIDKDDDRPWFGFVSFIGPHPPLAPPVPFNRIYHPDRMPSPISGDQAIDKMDEYLNRMDDVIWAEDVDDLRARCCKARYYGELTYIDWCVGRLLDAVEARPDGDNTLIAFFSDHGDHLGDHGHWQKESYFEASAHIPMLLSWPAKLQADTRNDALVGLNDLFAIATGASGDCEPRDGMDVLAMLAGDAPRREHYVGYYGIPGTDQFKIMIRRGEWKYIYFANSGEAQLFNVAQDPHELTQRIDTDAEVAAELRALAIEACRVDGAQAALDGDDLLALPRTKLPRGRVYQMNAARGATGFPQNPRDVVDAWTAERGV